MQQLADVESWCNDSHMILSLKKCKVVWFCREEFDIGIENVSEHKILGVKIDKKLNFEEHVLSIIDYVKKRLRPLRYLVRLGLSDRLAREFVLGLRSKFTYGVYWWCKIPETRKKSLETWWANALRATLGARRRLSRCYLFAAAGVPELEPFVDYLIAKRAFHWNSKNLERRPFCTLQQAIEALPDHSTHQNSHNVRTSTKKSHARASYDLMTRNSTGITARIHAIVDKNPEIFRKTVGENKWTDFKIRRALGANTEKLRNLWDKKTRKEIFEKYTPKFPPKPSLNQSQTET